MSEQQKLHQKALRALMEIETIIDRLKVIGPDELNGSNALMNLAERIHGTLNRFPRQR